MSQQTEDKNFMNMRSCLERGTSLQTQFVTLFKSLLTCQLPVAIENQSRQNLCLLSFFGGGGHREKENRQILYYFMAPKL